MDQPPIAEVPVTYTPMGPHRTVSTTTTYSYDTRAEKAANIKMVGDELLAATGSVVFTTWNIIGYTSGGMDMPGMGGADFGRKVGDKMYHGIDYLRTHW